MSFKKIPKEKWMQFSQDEKDYYTLEFQKDAERRLKTTVIVTRIIAVLLVVALFFIGFAMLNAVKEYGQIKDQYGRDAFCYLCGLERFKKCECQYISTQGANDYILEQRENLSLALAEYNIRSCDGMKVQDGSYQYANIPLELNLNEGNT